MGRKAGVSIEEQQVNAARRQAYLAALAAKKELLVILKGNIHLYAELLRHAKNLGYTAKGSSGALRYRACSHQRLHICKHNASP